MVSADDSASLVSVLFAQQICLGVKGMASAITTGWHFCEIKGDQSASKELTLPALTFSKVEIKALLQKIYSNSNAQSATVCLSGVYLSRTRTSSHSNRGYVTSRWRPSAKKSQHLWVFLRTSETEMMQLSLQERHLKKTPKKLFYWFVLSYELTFLAVEDPKGVREQRQIRVAFNLKVPVNPERPHHGSPLIR